MIGQKTKLSIELGGGVNLDMVWVEPGSFLMGSPENEPGRYDWEHQHQVELGRGFWIGKYQVTRAQYREVTGVRPGQDEGYELPVVDVSWSDARGFCESLNRMKFLNLPEFLHFRLPTEAEWEYACRGGRLNRGYRYSGSDTLDDVAWYSKNSGGKVQPVGRKSPNDLELYDMSGNVWEWCRDWFAADISASRTNPSGPVTGLQKVIRGGSWVFGPTFCRSACRLSLDPAFTFGDLGFRAIATVG